MPALDAAGFVTRDPGAYTPTLIGTAAGTTTIANQPTFFRGILVPNRVASAIYIVYDSVGTSGTVLGTIVLGTQTFSDPPPLYEFNVATKNGLTVTNSGNAGAIVLYK